MKSVAIIGAGITGLTAAFYLKRQGVPVTVYEAGGRVGGVIQSIRKDGFLAELGPNTIIETSPKIAQLVRAAGLEARKLATDPKAEARYVVRYGRPIEMPGSVPGFFTTKLFTAKAKLAVLREPFIKPRRDGVEESIAQFVVRRFNQEFLDHAIDALVAGIYAGDPHKLSLPHAFPKLKALEDNYGSMIKGQLFGARDRKKSGEVAKDRAAKFSFDEGLQVLPDTLAAQLGDSLKLNTPVTKLTQTADGWRVTFSEGRVPRVPNSKTEDGDSWNSSLQENEAEHSAVIYCGTAHRLAELEIVGAPSTVSARTKIQSETRRAGARRSNRSRSTKLFQKSFSAASRCQPFARRWRNRLAACCARRFAPRKTCRHSTAQRATVTRCCRTTPPNISELWTRSMPPTGSHAR